MSLEFKTVITTNWKLADSILDLNQEGYKVISSEKLKHHKVKLYARKFFGNEISIEQLDKIKK